MLRRSLAAVCVLVCVTLCVAADARVAPSRLEVSPLAADADVAVYVTKTGKKYHRETCRHLDQSKRKTTLAQAKKDGLTACKVCKAP